MGEAWQYHQKSRVGHPTIFSPEQEDNIEKWAIEMSQAGTPVDQTMILKAVSLLSHNLGMKEKPGTTDSF
jgi:hypothetical protein